MYFNSDALKQTIATQVDYVELIVSRNTEQPSSLNQQKMIPPIEFPKMAEAPTTPPKPMIKEEVIIEDSIKQVSPKRAYTVHSQSHSISNSGEFSDDLYIDRT